MTVIGNFTHSQQGILEQCSRPSFTFDFGDESDKELYGELITRTDAIINLAAYVGVDEQADAETKFKSFEERIKSLK